MKSKKAQRILLFCVLVVWGLIFYRIFIYFKKDDPIIPQLARSMQAENNRMSDSLILLLNYTDPFHLSKPLSLPMYNRKQASSTISKVIATNIEGFLKVPDFIYKGCIYNQVKHKYTGIILSNQTTSFITEEDSIQSWEIAKIYKDSLLITHSKQKACIILSK